MSNSRSRIIGLVFAAGALAGYLAAPLLSPQPVSAGPTNQNGQKFEELWAEIATIKSGISAVDARTGGIDRVDGFTVLLDPTKATELLVECSPDADTNRPGLRVCGPAVFVNSLGQQTATINDQGEQYADFFATTTLQVAAPDALITPEIRAAFAAVGPSCFRPDADYLTAMLPLVGIEGTYNGEPMLSVKAEPDPAAIDTPMLMPMVNFDADALKGSAPTAEVLALQSFGKQTLVGPTRMVAPTGDPDDTELLSISSAGGAMCINPLGIELLVECGAPLFQERSVWEYIPGAGSVMRVDQVLPPQGGSNNPGDPNMFP